MTILNCGPRLWCFSSHREATWGFPGGASAEESASQCRRPWFDPRVWKSPWRRAWQATPVVLPGESHGQRSLAGSSPQCRRVRHNWAHTHAPPKGEHYVCVFPAPESAQALTALSHKLWWTTDPFLRSIFTSSLWKQTQGFWRRGSLLCLHNNQGPSPSWEQSDSHRWCTCPYRLRMASHNYEAPEDLGQDTRVLTPEPPPYVGTTTLLLPREEAGPTEAPCADAPAVVLTESLQPRHQACADRSLQRIPTTIWPATSAFSSSQLRPQALRTRGNPSQLSPAWISDYGIWEQNKSSWYKLLNFLEEFLKQK